MTEISIYNITSISKETKNHLDDNPSYICKSICIKYKDDKGQETEVTIKLFSDMKDTLRNI